MKKKKKKKININFNKEKIISFIKENIYIIFLILPFIAMDLITRIYGSSINFYGLFKIGPNLFTISWIIFFVGLTLSFKKKIGKFIYLFFNIIFLILFLTNTVYFHLTKNFFDFSLLESASEGSPYIIDTLLHTDIVIYLSVVFIILLIIIGYKNIPNKEKFDKKIFIGSMFAFLIIHTIAPLTLGKADSELTWSSWRNPRNIYISFNDSNKSIKVSGLFEYSVRNFYITFLKSEETINNEDIEFLENAFGNEEKSKNKYTGKFEGKNLIFFQLEGLDNWLLTEEDTPTLYKMQNNAYNFMKHFSYYNGGGSTFNSEFAVNTGFITPLSYTKNAYTFNKNEFPYTMAKTFKNLGYSVNAFHMNNGEYYSRSVNYKNWGYDHYYGLIDMVEYEDKSYMLDRELILNEIFNGLLFPEDDFLFVDYIIAYSSHTPFTNTKGVCKMLYDLDHPDELEEERIEMSEEECARRQARETDHLMELLLQELETRGLLNNTIIVVYADHYLYTLEDKTILDKYKETSNNLINNTPFFIWSNNLKKETINKVTSQLNILPTVLNLFGIPYNPNNYIGSDALDSNYKGLVFFSDYSWYDGNVYVENGEVTNNKKISLEELEEKNFYVSYITKKNDLALKFNYFNRKEKE